MNSRKIGIEIEENQYNFDDETGRRNGQISGKLFQLRPALNIYITLVAFKNDTAFIKRRTNGLIIYLPTSWSSRGQETTTTTSSIALFCSWEKKDKKSAMQQKAAGMQTKNPTLTS
ncbi:hypothetical protein T06_16537 [Trichinella sp. T6]|nr:hypothetical protein T06_16537 [Trichinella sp. T6]